VVRPLGTLDPWSLRQKPFRKRLFIWRASALDQQAGGQPGTLVKSQGGTLAIATNDGLLLPREVQPENRRAMSWEEFLRGSRLTAGARFEGSSA